MLSSLGPVSLALLLEPALLRVPNLRFCSSADFYGAGQLPCGDSGLCDRPSPKWTPPSIETPNLGLSLRPLMQLVWVRVRPSMERPKEKREEESRGEGHRGGL